VTLVCIINPARPLGAGARIVPVLHGRPAQGLALARPLASLAPGRMSEGGKLLSARRTLWQSCAA